MMWMIAYVTLTERPAEMLQEIRKLSRLSTVCLGYQDGNLSSYIVLDSRSFLTASYRSLLHSYILSPPSDSPSPALLNLLASSRIKHVDLSYLDEDSGSSLLHEAARRKDLRLIELTVRAGADVFVRDRKGKMAHEGVGGKDERVKVFLRQCELGLFVFIRVC